MFGLVIPNFETLDESEKSRYQSIYCGLCHVLRDKYSNISRLALSYDLTFLSLLLNSLYEPKESSEYCNCIFHPGKKYSSTITEFSEYCADMTILLAYHKILDDINDEQKLRYKISEKALRNQYDKVKTAYPELCTNTENYMQAITEIENSNKHESDGDTAANIFGLIMAEIFAPKQDIWKENLCKFGANIGRLIYFMDAAIDFEKDKTENKYNPFFAHLNKEKLSKNDIIQIKENLTNIAGQAIQYYEKLPIVKDSHLINNILYEGIWLRFNHRYKDLMA